MYFNGEEKLDKEQELDYNNDHQTYMSFYLFISLSSSLTFASTTFLFSKEFLHKFLYVS